MPVYRKCKPGGRLVIPWKFGEEENVERLIPTNVLTGRERRRTVPTFESVMDDMRIGEWAEGTEVSTIYGRFTCVQLSDKNLQYHQKKSLEILRGNFGLRSGSFSLLRTDTTRGQPELAQPFKASSRIHHLQHQ